MTVAPAISHRLAGVLLPPSSVLSLKADSNASDQGALGGIPTMPILIDGHNLIGRSPALSLQDSDDEMRLVRMLMSYQARTGRAITVVFDPGGAHSLAQTRTHGRITVVFATHGGSADAVITRRVQRSRNASEWLVVTSDRELADTVVRLGARVRSVEAFAEELAGPRGASPEWKDTPPPPEEVEAWLAEFEERG